MKRSFKATKDDDPEDVVYEVGDLVWAKMKTYPPWPGMVVIPQEEKKAKEKNLKYIFFFGTNNYAWINVGCLKPYFPYREIITSVYKTKSFKMSCLAIEAYAIENNLAPPELRKSLDTHLERDNLSDLSLENVRPVVCNPHNRYSDSVTREVPTHLTYGFVSFNDLGLSFAMKLLSFGHKVMVWSQTENEIKHILDAGAFYVSYPATVFELADIIFSCNTNPGVAKKLVYSDWRVLSMNDSKKAYVELSDIDPVVSRQMYDSIAANGGRYLEVVVHRDKSEAGEENLILLAGGDKTVFDDCQSAFGAISNSSRFLGEIGAASMINTILNSMQAVVTAGLAESMALTKAGELSQKQLMEVLGSTSLVSPLMMEKGKAMVERRSLKDETLGSFHKDVVKLLEMSQILDMDCPTYATTNEMFKFAKRFDVKDCKKLTFYQCSKFDDYFFYI